MIYESCVLQILCHEAFWRCSYGNNTEDFVNITNKKQIDPLKPNESENGIYSLFCYVI